MWERGCERTRRTSFPTGLECDFLDEAPKLTHLNFVTPGKFARGKPKLTQLCMYSLMLIFHLPDFPLTRNATRPDSISRGPISTSEIWVPEVSNFETFFEALRANLRALRDHSTF